MPSSEDALYIVRLAMNSTWRMFRVIVTAFNLLYRCCKVVLSWTKLQRCTGTRASWAHEKCGYDPIFIY